MTDLQELMACPFCGHAESLYVEHADGTILHPAYYVRCDYCGAQTGATDSGKHVEIWNTRHTQQVLKINDLNGLIALPGKWRDEMQNGGGCTNVKQRLADELESFLRSPAFAEMARDAERYRYIQLRIRGIDASPSEPQRFEFPLIEPISNLMRGSVAGHLDDAIDAVAIGSM